MCVKFLFSVEISKTSIHQFPLMNYLPERKKEQDGVCFLVQGFGHWGAAAWG